MIEDKELIVSMTTIPIRKLTFERNVYSILELTELFDKFILNIDDNISDLDKMWYFTFCNSISDKFEIYVCNHIWRSCNKLIPTLLNYPDAIIITMDDDVYYPNDCIELLVNKYLENQDCIICLQSNPISIDFDNKFISYHCYPNGLDVLLQQKCWSKYLSCCCLFPPHIFDGSHIFNYDEMMYCTNGCHDELWFWVNSTINNVQVINVGQYITFVEDDDNGNYSLLSINDNSVKVQEYMEHINELFGEKLFENITNTKVNFVITNENAIKALYYAKWIKNLYNGNYYCTFNAYKPWNDYFIYAINS